jgi:hypothetical protein
LPLFRISLKKNKPLRWQGLDGEKNRTPY